MHRLLKSKWFIGSTALIGLGSAVAIGAPWDVDMVDSQAVRGYECWEYEVDTEGNRKCIASMRTLPEGVLSQAHLLTQNTSMTSMMDQFDPRWLELQSPLGATPEVLATGERMFEVYCTPCHGVPDEKGEIAKLGTVGQPGRIAGVQVLTGDAGVLKGRADGQVYRAIRMGVGIMPAYGWAMTDDEIWSVVTYARTLDNAAYIPPAPPPVDDGADDATDGDQP